MISEGILNEAKDESIKFQNLSTSDDYSKQIQKLQDLLEKETSDVENVNIEDIQDPEFQEQIKEIEHLKKQINDNKINDVDDYKYKDTLQILDNFKQDLENNFKSYEQLINEKINIIKGSLNEQTNKFEDILKEINEAIKENINYGNSPVKELNVENVQDNKDINMDYKDNSNNNNLYDREINTQNKDNNIDIISNNNMPKENKNYKRKNPNNKKNLLNENQINEKNREMINTKGPIDTIKIIKNNDDEIYELPEKNEYSFINNEKKENNTYNINGLNFFRKQNNNLSNNTNNLNIKHLLGYEKPKEEGCKLKYPNSNTVIINNKYNNNNININNNNNNEIKDWNDKRKNEGGQEKLYQSINSIFFYDYQQKYIKDQKINEYKKEELQKEIFNDKIKGRNILKDYYMNYIETIILPLFKKNKNIIQSKLETIIYNISIILECLGMNKNYYNNYFYQGEPGQKHFSRAQSRDAMLKFRKEFKISKEVITDEALVNKLEDNNLNIYKTFGKMFG